MHRQKSCSPAAAWPRHRRSAAGAPEVRNVLIQAGVPPEESAGEDLRQFLVRGHAGPLRPSVRRARTLSIAARPLAAF
jgi:hypothetical protein